jgi:membrane associated rhomboid family serine protease
MPEIGVPFVVVSILCGAVMGFALGRSPGDRKATLAAALACAVVGGVTWAVASTATSPSVAGVAMTLGGATATLVLVTTGRRVDESR